MAEVAQYDIITAHFETDELVEQLVCWSIFYLWLFVCQGLYCKSFFLLSVLICEMELLPSLSMDLLPPPVAGKLNIK